jgi:hypothetical protein
MTHDRPPQRRWNEEDIDMMQIIIEEASYLSPEAAREVAEEVARTVNLTFTPKH